MSKLIVAVALSCLACGSSPVASIGPEPSRVGVERPDAAATPALVPGDSPAASPATVTATCSTPYGSGLFYASQDYPGLTIVQLANVRAIRGYDANGFQSTVAPTVLRDGTVATMGCKQGETVTFVGP